MAVGLCNANATFQSLMSSISHDGTGELLVVHIDDLLIFLEYREDHLNNLDVELKVFKKIIFS